ncbi:MAG TPA: lamin tail domain-containing protein, partial [Candidatus Paceibacterota bacterium]|nr:lamin tail domain-containing protein [Candidatus Paceibacterota bacterium]
MKSTQRANRVLLFIIILFALPGVSHAAVIINEVMYDPPGSNTKAQWLELYNNGDSTVDLSKWSVTDGAKGSSGNLTKHAFNVPPKNGGIGSATIPAGGYVVVADDAATFESVYPSVPNVVDSVFSLSNVASLGAEVDLVDAQGNTADTLTFSADQYASNLGNSVQRAADKLVSALPTPGAANATSDYIPPSDDEDSSNTDSDTNTSNTTSDPGYVSPPLPQIFADAGGDRSVIVGADAKFVASAYDRDRSVIKYAKFSWNFGDGSEAEGPWVMHHFSYPGRYAVELTITNQKLVSSDRITVVAEPADVTLATLSDGGVSIQNRSDHDLDLSF